MPVLKCPACRAKGEVRGTEEFFEVRGRWPGNDYGWPVLKCRACGAGLIGKPRLVAPGVRATVIDAETWARMEAMWEDAFGDDESDSERQFAPLPVAIIIKALHAIYEMYPAHRVGQAPDVALDATLNAAITPEGMERVSRFHSGLLDDYYGLTPDQGGRHLHATLVQNVEKYHDGPQQGTGYAMYLAFLALTGCFRHDEGEGAYADLSRISVSFS